MKPLTKLYPNGNGKPDCPQCHGRGAVPGELLYGKIPTAARCPCVIVRQTLQNMDRGWVGLPKVRPVPNSPLKGRTEETLWITASDDDLRKHLRHVAARMGPDWYFKVISDKDLITAWLSTVALKGAEIMDPDAASEMAAVSMKFATIEDLAEPPTLLIIKLGVKAARNVAMPEVLQEAIQHRLLRDKPTWVVDQPTNPLRMGHICWSGQVQATLDDYEHLWLDGTADAMPVTSAQVVVTDPDTGEVIKKVAPPKPPRPPKVKAPPPPQTEPEDDPLARMLTRPTKDEKARRKKYSQASRSFS